MNIFKRLFKIGEAEANSAIDKMEDPIKLTEQGIRDLRQDLDKNMEALAQVKALKIRAQNDFEEFTNQAQEYENKAIQILQKVSKGEMSSEEADRLAKEALIIKERNTQKAKLSLKEKNDLQNSVDQIENNVQKIKSTINKWENELRTLKARVKVSTAKTSINKQMSELDSTGTVSMLERMKEKIAQKEALADAYSEIAEGSIDINEEIDKAVDMTTSKAEDELKALKEKLNNNQ